MRNKVLSALKELLNIKALAILLSFSIAVYALFVNRTIEIRPGNEGPTVLMRGNEPASVVVLLPANQLWLDTGLVVKPNQELKMSASGSANFALHRLVDSARVHRPLDPRWFDANGDSSRSIRPIDELRKPFMIADAPHGKLIAGIVADNKQLTKDNPKPDEIHIVGKESRFTSQKGGRLWLVVNETVLNDKAESVYVAGLFHSK